MTTDSTPRDSEITLFHPLIHDVAVNSGNFRDGLNNAAATLHMLADLFGDAETDRYSALDSAAARHGMFLQLQGVAYALEAIEAYIGREAEAASEGREAERLARQDRRRAEEDALAEDPEVIKRRLILAGAMADIFRKVLSDPPDRPADATQTETL